MAFLDLGERLRQRGQLEAAASVALAGLHHYPGLAAAHDLLARIRADQGDDQGAVAGWRATLECDPSHVGAHKGLAFVAFRARDLATAERQLELAALQAPHDATVVAALDRVRALQPSLPPTVSLGLDDAASGALLFDMQGMRLAGGSDDPSSFRADAVAAEGAGLTRECQRATDLLGLGRCRHLVIETADARVALIPVSDDAALMLQRGSAVPLGRLLAFTARAAQAARDWLERMP
jgi:predicted regulator of Ras-like GTPase activity (Roadblock/LC7/MglB family)